VSNEKLQAELTRLRKLQSDARYNEIFGGFSKLERNEYEERQKRIYILQAHLEEGAVAEQPMTAGANQRREWNRRSETDIPQAEARQQYHSREKDSSKAFTDSLTGSQNNRPRSGSRKDRQ
jgi:uncharacterized protein YdaT